MIAGDLLAQDGATMAVAIYLADQIDAQASDAEVVAAIEAAIRPLAGEFDRVFQIGPPAVREAITRRILQDQVTLLPLSVVVLVLALTVAMKRPRYAPVPLVTAGLSVLWTLGLMAALSIPLNLVTAIVPALLIIVGSTEDIHLLTAYQAGIREGRERGEAIGFMASSTGLAVLLTFVTTYLGFLSIALNDIRILQQFGLVASTGLLFNFVITVLLVPIYLRFFGESGAGGDAQPSVYSRLALWIYPVIQRHKRRYWSALVDE